MCPASSFFAHDRAMNIYNSKSARKLVVRSVQVKKPKNYLYMFRIERGS